MDFTKERAIFLQIAEMLFESILADKWPESERMPSIREMAVSMEVNPNTVIRTYAYLQEKDIIFNRRGIGYFVSPTAKHIIKSMKRDRFIKTELPMFVSTMKQLGIDFDDLRDLHEESS